MTIMWLWLSVFSAYAQLNTTYSNTEVEKTSQYKEGNIFQKDFLLFVDMLEETHPAFSPSLEHPFCIDTVRAAGYNWSKECESENELSSYIQSILTKLKDGHTSISHKRHNEGYYPFAYKVDKDKYYLNIVSKEFEQFLGEEITHMNGTQTSKVIDSFKKVISHDNETGFISKINRQIRFYFLWESTPYFNVDRSLNLTFGNGESITLYPVTAQSNLARIPQPKVMANSVRKKTDSFFHYTLLSDKEICYLQFNKCYDKGTERSKYQRMGMSKDDIEQRIANIPYFTTFLDSMFTDIDENNVTILVIDVRGNGGGGSAMCNELLTRLKKATKKGTAAVKYSKLHELNNPNSWGSHKKRDKLYKRKQWSQMKILTWTQFLYNKNIFKGEVIFIQDHVTFSSAGMLITNAVDNKIGIVIGSKSTYSPCHYGDILRWQLPNTKISGIMSHKIFYRPNKRRCNEKYIIPDVELSTDMADGDKCWEWILNNNK